MLLSERQLSRGLRPWWNRWTPGLNPVWLEKMLNESSNCHRTVHWDMPLHSKLPAHDADLISETAFGLVAHAVQTDCLIQELSLEAQHAVMNSAVNRIMILRGSGRCLIGHMTSEHLDESNALAYRFHDWLIQKGEPIEIQPKIAGLGIVNACHPDAILGENLVEVKMSRSLFRLDDIRQVLIYAALIWRGTDREIKTITLTNPRLGIDWQFQIKSLVYEISGKTASQFFEEFECLGHCN